MNAVDNSMKTFYVTFPFGVKHTIGVGATTMHDKWVEIRARSRPKARSLALGRFGMVNWQLHSEESFTQDRRKFYPAGCCLVLYTHE